MGERDVTITTFDGAADRRLEAYVDRHPLTTYSGTSHWTMTLRAHYGLRAWHALAERDGQPVGALTLLINPRFMRRPHALTSPLSSSGGGFVADDAETTAALIRAAESCATDEDLQYVQLRLVDEPPGLTSALGASWSERPGFERYLLDLTGGADGVWNTVFRAKTRNQVRKAEKCGFTMTHGHDALADFTRVLHAGTKELGAPAPARGLFEQAVAHFGDRVTFLVLHDGSAPIAGAVLFRHGTMLSNPWTVTLRAYRPSCANSLLYWHAAQLGIDAGAHAFDLGRSAAGSSTADFKRRLGATPQPIRYYYHRRQAHAVPDAVPSGRRAEWIRTCWRHSPDLLTRRLGDRLLRELI